MQAGNEKGQRVAAQVDMERTRSTHAQRAMPTGQGAWEKPPEQQPPVLNSPDCANHGTQIFTSLCFILNTLPSL